MNKADKLFNAIGNIDDRFLSEALHYQSGSAFHRKIRKLVCAAAGICLLAGIAFWLYRGEESSVTVYAYESDQLLEKGRPVLLPGVIDDSGQMQGHPLQFYILGERIEKIRFSCKNEWISFVDWTEQREDYGLSKSFTVAYGTDEEEYYYLVVDWVPKNLISKLTDNADTGISDLKSQEREDIIVMEIDYLDGRKETMAVTISLNSEGRFTACAEKYEITEEDDFVSAPECLPAAAGEEWTDASPSAAEETITFQGRIIENTIDTLSAVILVEPLGDEIPYDAVFFELPESEADRALQIGEAVWITCENSFTETAPHWGNLVMIESARLSADMPEPLTDEQIEEARQSALAYYEDTVFTVNTIVYADSGTGSMSEQESGGRYCIFSVNVSRKGAVQEPDRTIVLELEDGVWKVINEGY